MLKLPPTQTFGTIARQGGNYLSESGDAARATDSYGQGHRKPRDPGKPTGKAAGRRSLGTLTLAAAVILSFCSIHFSLWLLSAALASRSRLAASGSGGQSAAARESLLAAAAAARGVAELSVLLAVAAAVVVLIGVALHARLASRSRQATMLTLALLPLPMSLGVAATGDLGEIERIILLLTGACALSMMMSSRTDRFAALLARPQLGSSNSRASELP
jgi:hypothetical protein